MTAPIPKVGVIIQARMDSSRLPGKVLMPLAGRPLLEWLIERVRRARRIDRLVIATSDRPANEPIARLANDMGVDCVRGDETDVLSRFVLASEQTGCEIIVRLTADNPFVDGELLDYMLAAYMTPSPLADYANNIEDARFPYGLYAEIFPVTILKIAAERGQTSDDREHVTHFFRMRPVEFSYQSIEAPGEFIYDNLTVDTPAQYAEVSALFEKHVTKNRAFTFRDLLVNTPSIPG